MADQIPGTPDPRVFETELESPRLQLYLRHKADIGTWAALKSEVRAATSELHLGLQDDVEALAPELSAGSDPEVNVRNDGVGTRWPRIVIYRRTWQGDGVVLAGVALEWTTKVNPGGNERPYVGIRVERGTGHGAQLVDLLRTAVGRAGSRELPVQTGNRYWAAYSYVDREPDWWQDIAGWRQRVMDRFVPCWHLAAPMIDEAIAERRAGLENPGA